MPLHFVEFQSTQVILGIAPTILPLKSFINPDLLNKDFTNPNRYLIGRRVQIIKKNQYKAYHGIVKEIQQDGFVIVELAANMRRHRVRLSNLALTYVLVRKIAVLVILCLKKQRQQDQGAKKNTR